jgi:hypothetical protein
MIVMGNLAGYRGNRPRAEFAQRYGDEMARLLQVEPKAMPSFSTFRRAHLGLDFVALSDAFKDWIAQHISADESSYAIDGKRIRQPITAEDGKTHFVGLVSIFAHHQGITVDLAALTETDNSEIKVAQYLIEKLQLKGAILTLDAMHAQKKH